MDTVLTALPGDGAGAGAAVAAALFAVDPVGLGGVVLRSAAGPARERWLAMLAELLPAGTPWRRVPLHVNDDRLLGGLDLAATLQAGRPVAQRGLLAEADGGVLVLAMAERVNASTAAHIAAVLDRRELVVERHGVAARHASRLGVVALDEGLDDERPPSRLNERLAFHVELAPRREPLDESADKDALAWTRDDIVRARIRLADVSIPDDLLQGLCAAGLALGVDSIRATMLACAAARAAAALAGRDEVDGDDAALAAALVLAPRATQVPATEAPADGDEARDEDQADTDPVPEPPPEQREAPPPPSPDSEDAGDDESSQPLGEVDEMVLQAALAAIPPGLLAALALGKAKAGASSGGRAGALRKSLTRGRPIGTRQGELRGGARLNLLATLRTAAPWQALRRREDERAGLAGADSGAGGKRIRVRREDFQLWRYQQRSETTTVFVVDASGSSALHRLGEAKGAVELLLADCYVRRDSVAVIAFRGAGAELLLSPTRSLTRAKRGLAGLPGGGGTPLASGIDAALALGLAIRRRGATQVVVLLTDGRANIARDGTPGRARANEDASAAARQLRAEGFASLLIDTSPQPQETASQLAAEMGARYVALPHAGAASLSQVVRSAALAAPERR